MSKTDELRNFVSKLFEQATDKHIIEQVGAVTSKIDEIEQEQTAKQEEYNTLLKDYKDVVVHQSFKPNKAETGATIPNAFNNEEAFMSALEANFTK